MNICRWCGDDHGVDKLCQRAQRGMTRRSFFGLLGAGAAGLVLAPELSFVPPPAALPTLMPIPLGPSTVVARKLYRSSGNGVYKLIAVIADNSTATFTDRHGTTYSGLPTVGEPTPYKVSFVTPDGEMTPEALK